MNRQERLIQLHLKTVTVSRRGKEGLYPFTFHPSTKPLLNVALLHGK